MLIIDLLTRGQTVYKIGGVKIGGRPGELPTVLCGSIFYHKHKIVYDHKKGLFNKEKAEELIKIQEEWSDRTGNPCMIDVMGETEEALIKYLDFVASVSDSPILLNGYTAKVRLKATEFIKECGLLDRVVYTSINYTVSKYELDTIKNLSVKCVMIQTFNPRDPRPKGSLKLLLGTSKKNGLLSKVKEANVEKILLLPSVIDVPSIGIAMDTIRLLKVELGLPCGTAPCSVVGYWRRTKELGTRFKWMGYANALALSQLAGADFLIYGSIRKAPEIFPTCAMVDLIVAYIARFYGVKPLTKKHPIYTFS